MSGEVCDGLSKMPWKKYDVTAVPKMAGIYAIGQKLGRKDTEYLYFGRSNNVKRRLQEHKTPTPQQGIDTKKWLANLNNTSSPNLGSSMSLNRNRSQRKVLILTV